MNFQVERLKRLPQRTNETWQGGLARLPGWVDDGNRKPYRPWVGIWISLRTKLINFSEPKLPEKENFDLALQALADFACNQELAGYRPGKLEVKDAALAEHLGGLLSEAGITVEKRNKLFTLEETLADMGEHLGGKPLLPDALDVKGVTVDAMRAFADAASQFFLARPWEQLTNEDIIEVESPSVDVPLRYFSVLGNGGMALGLGFYESLSQFEELLEIQDGNSAKLWGNKHWMVFFGPITELPFGDADLWEDYDLPVAADEGYPVAMCYLGNGKVRRPGPDVIAFLEGLLRTLAVAGEEQIDTGRWTKVVNTSSGQMEFVLSLPYLLGTAGKKQQDKTAAARKAQDLRWMEKIQYDMHRILDEHEFADTNDMQQFLNENFVGKDIPHQSPRTPLEAAQDLIYEAFESRGRKRIQLARKALDVCRDCADAYVLLAEQAGDVEKARDLYAQGVAAGERSLGRDIFKEEVGHFWGALQTRPYMRARFGLAECLQEMGRLEDAAGHYRELLRLNPNDNQGVRQRLLPCLLEMNADDKAEKLLKDYKDDKGTALWLYARALLTFKRKGNTALARNHLEKAIDANEFVPDYLLEIEEMPGFVHSYSLGSKEEAVVCADLLGDAWEKTEGAIDWLESQTCDDFDEEDADE